MSATADQAAGRSPADRLGITAEMVVQERGYDEDCDEELRAAIIERIGAELVDADSDEVVDVVLLWWREDDGDLVDVLMEAKSPLADDGVVWLLTPKTGRDGHVPPSDVTEAAPTAGMAQTSTISAGTDWSGVRLVTPRSGGRAKRS